MTVGGEAKATRCAGKSAARPRLARFFVLRTGRWTPAYGHFERASADQRVLFTTDDEAAALAIVRARGVTHVIEDRARPVPWLARRAPLAETPELRLHAVGP